MFGQLARLVLPGRSSTSTTTQFIRHSSLERNSIVGDGQQDRPSDPTDDWTFYLLFEILYLLFMHVSSDVFINVITLQMQKKNINSICYVIYQGIRIS